MSKIYSADHVERDIKKSGASVATMDHDFLPPSVMDWLVDLHQRLGIPLDYLAASCVTAVGTVIGRQLGINAKANSPWLVIPNLWMVCIGAPGSMKTPGLGEGLRKPLAFLEKALDDKSNERLVALDCTPEALARILLDNPRGIVLFRDELSGLFQSFNKKGYENFRAFLLESWSGNGSYRIDRAGRGLSVSPFVTCCSIAGAIQPGVLSPMLNKLKSGEAEADGLFARLQMMVFPDNAFREQHDRVPNHRAEQKFYELFQSILRLDLDSYSHKILDGVPVLSYSVDAQENFNDWHQHWRKSLYLANWPEYVAAHFEKYDGLVPALSLIFHIMRGGKGPVELCDLEMAYRWVDYLKSHALKVYGVSSQRVNQVALLIVQTLQKKTIGAEFTARELSKKRWSGLTDPFEVRLALDWLVSENYFDVRQPGKTKFYRPLFSVSDAA